MAHDLADLRSHSEALRERMHLTCGRLYATYHRLWRSPNLHELIPRFFILMHQIVRASVPLMELARRLARQRKDVDRVCGILDEYLSVHIDEERDHDHWVLDDLEANGISRDAVVGSIPSRHVASLVGAQYYWIQHYHPVALMGYIRLLEGNAPSVSHIEQLQSKSGRPATLFRTYRLHGELDVDHLRELDSVLDSLPLSELQAQLVWISASHSASALADCLDDLERECSRAGTVVADVRPSSA